jgi:hypothetical protein
LAAEIGILGSQFYKKERVPVFPTRDRIGLFIVNLNYGRDV